MGATQPGTGTLSCGNKSTEHGGAAIAAVQPSREW
jgi:hypothetical protein